MLIDSLDFKNIEKELGTKFKYFCSIKLLSNNEKPQLRYKNDKHYPYLSGVNEETEFCHFKTNLPTSLGLYMWVVNKEIVYIGQAQDLEDRFNVGYGNISPRNCFKGGQSTNVRMNLKAKQYIESGKKIDIYIYVSNEYISLEKELLKRIKTNNNIQY